MPYGEDSFRKGGTGDFPKMPDDYLKGGYFKDDRKNIRDDLLLGTAENVAKAIGFARGITNSQLRRFYGHAKNVQVNLELTGDYQRVKGSILSLKSFAAEAFGKEKIKRNFYEFISKNIEQIEKYNDPDVFTKGFMKHFEAVVAYFYSYYPKN
jgi:CRISPR type III-A/MTUBE-associated protein Csm2